MRKRACALVATMFALFICIVGFNPPNAFAADGDSIFVGGVELTGSADAPAYATTDASGAVTAGGTEDAYNVKWDGTVLTLNGATVTQGKHEDAAIYLEHGDLAIVLEGDNAVVGPDIDGGSPVYSRGIYAYNGTVSISGNGGLTVEGGDVSVPYGMAYSYGIWAAGNVEISGGTVSAAGGTVANGNGTSGSYGISANQDILFSGGNVTVTGGEAKTLSYGAYAALGDITLAGGEITATSSQVGTQSQAKSHALYGYEGVVVEPANSERVSVAAGASEADASLLQGSPFETSTTITDLVDGQRYVKADTAAIPVVQSYDIWVEGIKVTSANASDVLGDGTVSYDPASNTLTLNNATIDYQENKDDNTKGAILFSGDMNIDLVGENVITSVTSGIYADGPGNLVVTGGALTVDAVYYGIGSADASRNVTVSGVDLDVDVDRRSPFIGVGIQAGGQLLITDGTVAEVTGTGADTHPVIGNGGLSIVDSEVYARVNAEGQYANSMILSDHDIVIDNSIVEAIAGDTYDFGLLAGNDLIPSEGNITIKNNSQVTASSASGIAVYTMIGDVAIEDSKVVATSSGHNAMYINGGITISGASDVTASSPYAALAPDGSITIDPKGGLVDIWKGSSEESASKTADSPLSQSATLKITSKYFHSAPHVHAFTERVEDDAYLASAATCTYPATYYLSCECGAAGTDTFTVGSALGHTWGEWEVANAATCTEPGTEERTCARCGDIESREVPALGHSFADGTCTACGAADPNSAPPEEPAGDAESEEPAAEEPVLAATGDPSPFAAAGIAAIAGVSALTMIAAALLRRSKR